MDIPQGYKQTELGIIPEDWEVKSFSQVFDMYPNNTYPRDCMNDSYGAIRNIHYGDILIKYPTIVDVERCSIPYLNEDVKIKAQKFVQSGDVIIADTAEDETVGKCVEIKNAINAKIVSGLHTFFCHPIRIFAIGWWGYYLNSSNYHNQLLPYITGIKVSSISRASIQETKLLVPPIAEQKAIAEALGDIDGLIATLDKKIAKKHLIKQGAMQQLLTGKKRLPGFSDPWVERKLGEIGVWVKGQSLSKNDITPNGKNICIHYGELFSYGEVITSPISRTNSQPITISLGNEILFPDSDVTPDGLGRCSALLMKDVIIGSGVNILRHNPLYDTSFVSYSINANRSKIIDRVTGTTVKHINSKELSEVVIEIPKNKDEQIAIATMLNDMDKEIDDLEAQRDKYRLLKSGMMQKLLTGQIRLKIK
ncbi:restriction endonuclease subunit S [Barnesiella intestinihominis]|uniref:restriction endonuclease subunit S n=1 Tax=Barnesiella intestinihominis TaxID=487174 RepID=UPI002676752D|nr:restriction endonuclease subunit S [Barnesiella intestinihominis]